MEKPPIPEGEECWTPPPPTAPSDGSASEDPGEAQLSKTKAEPSLPVTVGEDPAIEGQLKETIDEIVILQEYARSVGKRIPEKVLSDLGTFVNMSAQASVGEKLKLALSVHGELGEVVAPVTVRSLKATDPNQTLLSWLRHVWAIPVIFILTLLAFILFVTQTSLPKSNQKNTPQEKVENSSKKS